MCYPYCKEDNIMIKTKEELANKIKPLCERILFDKEKSNSILQQMQTFYNIPTK